MADNKSLDEKPLIHDDYIDLFLTLPESKVQFLSEIRQPQELEANNEPMTSAVYRFLTNSKWAPSMNAMRGIWEHIVKKNPEIDMKDSGIAFGLVTWDGQKCLTSHHELNFTAFTRSQMSEPGVYGTEFEFSSTCEAEGGPANEEEEGQYEEILADETTEFIRNNILTFSRCIEIFIQAIMRRHEIIRNSALSDVEFAEQNSLVNRRNE